MPPPHDPTTDLTPHFGALRRLARDLVGADAADDVVQETALQALRTPPRRQGPLGGWLAAVLRHVASHHRRAERRRSRHEAAAAQHRADLATRTGTDVETLQALTAALAALAEPYRTTVCARYLQERTPAAIAAATGEPVDTVKTRCKRGLQMLRERMAATANGRNWSQALVATFALEPAVVTTVAATTVVTVGTGGIMGTAATWWLGGAVGLVILSTLLWWTGPPPSSQAEVVAETAADATGAAATDRATLPTATLDTTRVAAPSPHASATTTISGRCLDDRGAPLAGVPLHLRGQLRLGVDPAADEARVEAYHGWLAAHREAPWQNLNATTGVDGTFALESAAAPIAARLGLRHDGIEHELELPPLVAGGRLDVGDLQLARACQVTVRAFDETSTAVPSAPIRLLREVQKLPEPRLRQPQERSASTADGAIATVTAGTWRVDVLGYDVVRGAECVVPPHVSTFAHTVVVAAPAHRDTIQGRVVDVRDQPLADVEVLALPGNSFARTAPDGRFVLPCHAPATAEVRLSLRRAGWSLAHGLLRARWGERDLRFVMEPTTTLRIHVVDDATGAALHDVTVWRWPDPNHRPLGAEATRGTQQVEGADAAGQVVLHDVPRGHHLVVVEPGGTTHTRSDALPIAVEPPVEGDLVVRLRHAASRELRIRGTVGGLVADAYVELLDSAAPPQQVTAGTQVATLGGWNPRHLPFPRVLWLRGRTDRDGAFLLRGPGDRPVAVRISPSGRPPFVLDPVSLLDPAPLHAEVPGGSAVRLTVGPAQFVAAFAEQPSAVAFSGPPPTPGFRLRRGAGREVVSVPATGEPPIPLAADGSLAFFDVAPGPWSLELQWCERCDGGATFAQTMRAVVATVMVPTGRDLVWPVDLDAWRPVDVNATVLRAGQPLADTMVSLTVTRPDLDGTGTLSSTVSVLTDARGHFRFRGRPGTATVQIEVPGEGRATIELASREEVLLPGDRREVTFAFP